MIKKYFTTALLLMFSIMLFSCSEKKEDPLKKEIEAKKVLKNADKLWQRGDELKALKVYDSLAEKYPETDAKKIAEEKLLKKGFSIGNSWTSWTSQRMFELENRVVEYREMQGEYPTGHQMKHPKDAWGKQIYFRLFPDKKQYDFLVISNGPDKLKGTSDDMIVVHTISGDDNGGSATPVDRAMASGSSDMSIEQLGDLADLQDLEDSGEATISLEQLQELAGKSGSGEMELSLDALRKLEGQ